MQEDTSEAGATDNRTATAWSELGALKSRHQHARQHRDKRGPQLQADRNRRHHAQCPMEHTEMMCSGAPA